MNIMSFLQTYVCQTRARKKKKKREKERKVLLAISQGRTNYWEFETIVFVCEESLFVVINSYS